MKYAVFTTGARQYKVQEGDELLVEKVSALQIGNSPPAGRAGKQAVFENVLLIAGDGEVKVGTPIVLGAKVEAEVLGDEKGEKIEIMKYKAKSRYRRHTGHRHQFTRIKISKITS